MKEFCLQLITGITSVPKNFKQLYERLKHSNCIEEQSSSDKNSDKIIYRLKKGVLIGGVHISKNKAGVFYSFDKAQGYFPLDTRCKTLFQNDIVVAVIVQRQGRKKAKVLLTIPLAEKKELFCIKNKGSKVLGIPFRKTIKPNIRIDKLDKTSLSLPNESVVNINFKKNKIEEVFGTLKDPNIDERISLALYHRKIDFSPESITLAESFGQEVIIDLYPDRLDLRHLPFCTIDPDDAKDHDDAIYFDGENSMLYVAIADVSEYVSPDTLLDEQAKERGFSVYFPHKCYPMLPENLSENICSLKQDKERLVLLWRLRIHRQNAEVITSELSKAIIINRQNISYTKLDKLLEGKPLKLHAGVKESLMDFYQIASKIHAKRLKNGYEFFDDEIKLKLDLQGQIESILIHSNGPSHMIVEEAMLLANKASAKFLSEKIDGKGIYRVHKNPPKEKIDELFFNLKLMGYIIPKDKNLHDTIQNIQKQAKKKNTQKQIDRMIIKAQSQATYSPQNIGHFGLGFEAYSHFTSPIRRYSDLILHRIMKEILLGDLDSNRRLSYLLEQLKISCILINDQENQIGRIETDFKDRKYARWAQKHIGVRLQAYVIDEQYPAIAIALDTIVGARLFVDSLPLDISRLDTIEVEIISADIVKRRISAQIIIPQHISLEKYQKIFKRNKFYKKDKK